MLGEDLRERPQARDLHDLEQLGAGMFEVRAQRVRQRFAAGLEGRSHHALDDRKAAPTTRAGAGARSHVLGGGAPAGDGVEHRAGGNVLARTHERSRSEPGAGDRPASGLAGRCAGGRRRPQHLARSIDEVAAAERRQDLRVRRRVADQHRGDDAAVLVDVEALVDARRRIVPDEPGTGALPCRFARSVADSFADSFGGRRMHIADARHADAEELQLRGLVAADERLSRRGVTRHRSGEAGSDHPRHPVAGSDESVTPAVDRGAFADRRDVGIARAQRWVDVDAAAFADVEAARTCQRVARSDAGREHHEVDVEWIVAVERQPRRTSTVGLDAERPSAEVDRHAERLDVTFEGAATTVVELHRHEAGRELDDVRVEPEVAQRIRRFEAQEPAADDCAAADGGVRRGRRDRIEIVERAIHETSRTVAPLHWRHEGLRTGREHEVVVGDDVTARGRDRSGRTVDRDDPIAEQHLDVVLVEEPVGHQRQVVGGATVEHRAECDPVVRRPRLVADDGDLQTIGHPELGERRQQAVADHAVADDDEAKGSGTVGIAVGIAVEIGGGHAGHRTRGRCQRRICSVTPRRRTAHITGRSV